MMKKIAVDICSLGALFVLAGCASSQSLEGRMSGNPGALGGAADSESRLPRRLAPSIRRPLEAAWRHFSEVSSRDDAEEILSAAESFLLVSAAVPEASLCPESVFWVTLRRTRVLATLQRHFFAEYLTRCCERYEQATFFSQAIQAAQDALSLLDQAMERDHWANAERVFLKELRAEWVGRDENTRSAFHANKERISQAQERTQRVFVTTHAIKDFEGANELYVQQRRKRFNYAIFGYPRDNTELLNMARMRLYRITGEPLVDAPVRTRAMMLSSTIGRRMERSPYPALALPDYRQFCGFPMLTEDELLRVADPIPSYDELSGGVLQLGARK